MQKSFEWKETILLAFALIVGLASYGIPLRGLVGDEDLLSGAVRNLTISYWKSTAAITARQGAAHESDSTLQLGKTTEVDLATETTKNLRTISEHNSFDHSSLNTLATSSRSGDRSCEINRYRTEKK